MSSNSVIISKLLTEEGNEFSSDIENFLNIKFNELKGKLNNHIQEKVNENINKFYSKEEIDIKKYFNNSLSENINVFDGLNKKQIFKKKRELYYNLIIPNQQCNTSTGYMIFEDCIISYNNYRNDKNYMFYMNIKNLYHIKLLIEVPTQERLLQLIRENNKLLYPNSLDFEKICEDEYNKINNIKEELKKKGIELYNLIEEQKKNINYYKELDDKNKSYEEDKKSFYEMKNNLLIAKDKIKLMKDELLKEKELFETEKEEFNNIRRNFSINTFDVDEFLNEK